MRRFVTILLCAFALAGCATPDYWTASTGAGDESGFMDTSDDDGSSDSSADEDDEGGVMDVSDAELTPPESCFDGVDNDGDDLVDCDDPSCLDHRACQPDAELCDDGIDNDEDGLTDCEDVDDCTGIEECSPTCLVEGADCDSNDDCCDGLECRADTMVCTVV